MSPPPTWYLQQADILYGRAAECRRLARELDGSPLPTLLTYAGDDTWQCPAASEFREFVVISQGRILDAINALHANAYGLANEADQMARTAAQIAAEQQVP